MQFYTVKAFGAVEEFIKIDTGLNVIKDACRKSEIQYLDRKIITIAASESGGIEFPDLIIYEDMYLFSNDVIDQIKKEIEEYVFLKPIEITCDVIGKKELYWLIVPPRIDCLDLDNSEVEDEWDFELGIIPVLHCKKTRIDEKLVGNFEVFKIAEIDDNNIYINENIKNKIININPEGIKIIAIKEE